MPKDRVRRPPGGPEGAHIGVYQGGEIEEPYLQCAATGACHVIGATRGDPEEAQTAW